MASVGELSVNLVARSGGFAAGLKTAQQQLSVFGQSAGGAGFGVVTNTVAKLNNHLNRMTAPITNVVRSLAPIGATVAFIDLFRQAESFNRAMTNSTAIMGPLSDAMRGNMVVAAQEVASATKFSAKEAAEAYFFLASAGLDAQQSIAALPKVAAFAQAGNFDLALATDLLTDAQSALGLSSKDAVANMANMERVSDVLVKANMLANASVQQFSEALTNNAGAAIRMVNKDVEEGVGVLAAFADQGLKGAAAGTAFGIVMRDLQTKALTQKSAFDALGISVFDNTGTMQNMSSIIGQLEGKLGGMNDAQRKATLLQLGFGDKSVGFIQTLIGTSEKIRDYEAALRSAGGTTADVADSQMTPFQVAMEKLSAEWEKFAINTATPMLEGLANVISTMVLPGLKAFVGLTTQAIDFIKQYASIIGFAVKSLVVIRVATMAYIAATKGLIVVQSISAALAGNWIGIAAAAVVGASAFFLVETAMGAVQTEIKQTADEMGKLAEQSNKLKDPSIVRALEERANAAKTLTAFSQATPDMKLVGGFDIAAESMNRLNTAQLQFANSVAAVKTGMKDPFPDFQKSAQVQLHVLAEVGNAFAKMAEGPGEVGAAAQAGMAGVKSMIDLTQTLHDKQAAVWQQTDNSTPAGIAAGQRMMAQASQEFSAAMQVQLGVVAQARESLQKYWDVLGGVEQAQKLADTMIASLQTPFDILAGQESKIEALFALGKIDADQKLQLMARAAEDFDKAIGGPAALISKLTDEVNQLAFGLTDTDMLLQRLRESGATMEQLTQISQLTEQADALKKQNSLMETGKSIFEQTRTPLEQMQAETARLHELFNAGAIDAETFNRALVMAGDRFGGTVDEAAAAQQQWGSTPLFGSREALSRQLSNSVSGKGGPAQTQEKVAKEQLEEQKKQRLILEEIVKQNQKMLEDGPIDIATI